MVFKCKKGWRWKMNIKKTRKFMLCEGDHPKSIFVGRGFSRDIHCLASKGFSPGSAISFEALLSEP